MKTHRFLILALITVGLCLHSGCQLAGKIVPINLNTSIGGSSKPAPPSTTQLSSKKSNSDDDDGGKKYLPKLPQGTMWKKRKGKCKVKRRSKINPFRTLHTLPVTGYIEAIADLNGDDRPDIISRGGNNGMLRVTSEGKEYSDVDDAGRTAMFVSLNQGLSARKGTIPFKKLILNRTLTESSHRLLNATPRGARVHDFDGDGDGDIVLGTNGGSWDHGLVIYEYKNRDRWEEHWVYEEQNAPNLEVADLNGDKIGDIIVAKKVEKSGEGTRNSFYWYPSKRLPLSEWSDSRDWDTEAKLLFISEIYHKAIILGAHDFDGDGDNDLLWVSGKRLGYPEESEVISQVQNLGWIENRKKGRKWKNHTLFTHGGAQLNYRNIGNKPDGNWGIRPMDFDGDGDIDLLTSVRAGYDLTDVDLESLDLKSGVGREDGVKRAAAKIILLENDGKGNFSQSELVSWEDAHYMTPLATDLDGDGDMELIAWGSKRSSILVVDYNAKTGVCKKQTRFDGKIERIQQSYLVDMDRDGDLDLLFKPPGLFDSMKWAENGPKRGAGEYRPVLIRSSRADTGPSEFFAEPGKDRRAGGGAAGSDDGASASLRGMCLLRNDGSIKFYRVCKRFSGGRCAQWGTKGCTPKSTCAWDKGAGKFRNCKLINGANCPAFKGRYCTPADSCVYSPKENRFRPCKKFRQGKCVRYSKKKCKPKQQAIVYSS